VLGIPDIIKKGYSAMDIRYLLLSVHYRTNLKFSFEQLDLARKSRLKIVEWMEWIEKEIVRPGIDAKKKDAATQKYIDEFVAAMDMDLNTSGALAAIHELMNHTYAAHQKSGAAWAPDVEGLKRFLTLARQTFGCFASEAVSVPADVQKLFDARALARKNKDFKASDTLRDQIAALGWSVRDEASGQVLKKM
jgi:cysteinyl-tRNA synthetase